MIQQAQAGEFELAYVDETGFALQPPNRSARSPVGGQHAVEPKRSSRPHPIGVLLASGGFTFAKLWQSVNGLWVFGFLMALIDRIQKPLVVILDNASIDTAKAPAPYWQLLKDKGLRFYFLPPYSPELNRIELLWKKVKYEWLPFRSFTPDEFEQAIDHIGAGIGYQYQLTFCWVLIEQIAHSSMSRPKSFERVRSNSTSAHGEAWKKLASDPFFIVNRR